MENYLAEARDRVAIHPSQHQHSNSLRSILSSIHSTCIYLDKALQLCAKITLSHSCCMNQSDQRKALLLIWLKLSNRYHWESPSKAMIPHAIPAIVYLFSQFTMEYTLYRQYSIVFAVDFLSTPKFANKIGEKFMQIYCKIAGHALTFRFLPQY